MAVCFMFKCLTLIVYVQMHDMIVYIYIYYIWYFKLRANTYAHTSIWPWEFSYTLKMHFTANENYYLNRVKHLCFSCFFFLRVALLYNLLLLLCVYLLIFVYTVVQLIFMVVCGSQKRDRRLHFPFGNSI